MSHALLVNAFAVAGSVLALWLYVRFGERRPRSLRRALVHIGVAGVLLALSPFAMDVVGVRESPRAGAVALFGVFLPAITYVFLAALYLLEQLQRALYAR